MNNFTFTHTDYHQIKQNFLTELQKAAKGEQSSIPYLKHSLPEQPLVISGIVQGIVIGGTNYILSTQEISADGTKKTLSKATGTIPVFKSKQILLDFLKEHQDKKATAIGLNFGFPLETTTGPHGELDGKLLHGTKEHTFTDVIDQPIGNLVREALDTDIPVTVANDTICLTLAGDGNENGSLIAGTGFNIGLKKEEHGKKTIINLEAGNFDKFELSEALKIIDECSETPGKQLFEKIISGKYLAEVFNIKAQRLGIDIPKLKTSQELSALSKQIENKDASELARSLLERSASLVAAAIAASYEFCDKPTTFTIIGEGSLLWLGWSYLDTLYHQLTLLGIPENTITIKHVQDSSIKGALGLLTQ